MKTSTILPAAHAPTAADLKITEITITPIAFSDPPLLNAVGVHEPLVHRVVIEVRTANGLRFTVGRIDGRSVVVTNSPRRALMVAVARLFCKTLGRKVLIAASRSFS